MKLREVFEADVERLGHQLQLDYERVHLKRIETRAKFDKETLNAIGWSTVRLTALGSWWKSIPRGRDKLRLPCVCLLW
jgi:hypothetical protein